MAELEAGYRIAKEGEYPKFYLAEDVEKQEALRNMDQEQLTEGN